MGTPVLATLCTLPIKISQAWALPYTENGAHEISLRLGFPAKKTHKFHLLVYCLLYTSLGLSFDFRISVTCDQVTPFTCSAPAGAVQGLTGISERTDLSRFGQLSQEQRNFCGDDLSPILAKFSLGR